jgi:response regulator of citrate/malate metabolism
MRLILKKKLKLFGLFGGGKEIQTPRARSYYELHGIYPYKEIKKLIEELVQVTDLTQYQQEQVAFQKEQVDIQKQMRDLIHKQISEKSKRKAVKQTIEEETEEEVKTEAKGEKQTKDLKEKASGEESKD